MITKRLPWLLVLAALLIPGVARPCQYKMNVYNHRLDGEKLRLYMEIQTLAGQSGADIKFANFDTRHTLGKGILEDVGTYDKKGNGLSTVLMIDRSASMRREQVKLREAAIQYVDTMEKGDEISMIFFAQEKHQYGFSADPGELRNQINREIVGPKPKTMLSKQTRLYNYLMDAIQLAGKEGSRELKLILVMSDGEEEVNAYSPQDIIDEAKKAKVGIFAIGFRINKKGGKTNLKDLEKLRQIAQGTGGKYLEVDASADLGGIFMYARKRVNKFLVLDEALCGITKAEAAANPNMQVQVLYEDCKSNRYPVSLNLLENDLAECPNCAKGGNADCADDQICVDGFCQKVTAKACQQVKAHQVVSVSCSSNEDCAGYGECFCEGGICAAGTPPCKPWETHDAAKNECVAQACDQGQACPEGSECHDQKTCGKINLCQPCQEKKDGLCFWVEDCATDCRCAPGCTCQEGACLASDDKAATERPKCKDCNAPVEGKCQPLECEEDTDCEASCIDAACVCAPEKGIEAEEGARKICQPLRKGPCEEAEVEVERDGETMCRVVPCDKDAQCKEGCICDEETSECGPGGIWKTKPELVIGGAAGALMLIIILIILLVRMRKRDDGLDDFSEEPEVISQKDMTQLDDSDQGGGSHQGGGIQGGGGGGSFGGRTMQDGNARGGGGHKATQVQASPYSLVVEYEGNVLRHGLSFGTIRIGRESGDILIPSNIVSNPHFQVDVTPTGVTVSDQGSTNGTFMGQMRLQPNTPVQFQAGQSLLLGSAVKVTLDADATGGNGQPSRKGATVIDR